MCPIYNLLQVKRVDFFLEMLKVGRSPILEWKTSNYNSFAKLKIRYRFVKIRQKKFQIQSKNDNQIKKIKSNFILSFFVKAQPSYLKSSFLSTEGLLSSSTF